MAARPGRKTGTTLAQVDQRKLLVFEMMLQGMRPANIYDLIVTNAALKGSTDAAQRARYRPELDWGVGFDTICDYYAHAHGKLLEEQVIDRRAAYRQTLMRYEDLYRRCVASGDMGTARQLLADKKKLLELSQFEHGGDAPGATKQAGADRAMIELPNGRTIEI